jgi:GlpG protein
LIALCCLVFFLSALQQLAYVEKGVPESVYLVTTIQSDLYIDVPAPVEHLEIELQKYAPPEGQAPRLPQSLITEIQAVGQAPFWRGYAQMLDIKMKGGDPSIADGPMFTKVKEGEFWRLITPIFLHGSILHILFNMLWLWVLGKQIEEKVGAIRYLILTLAIGVFANVVQYLATGPFFLGYSGVVMGLAGFIWSRERIAKWEGYPLRQSMILFLALFVVALTGLELISFGLVYFGINSFEPNIANSAHIGGAVIGALLGRLPFFAARPNL